MLWIKLKHGETVNVQDDRGNHVGVLHAHQRGGCVRIGFDQLQGLTFKRQPAPPIKDPIRRSREPRSI